MTAFIHILYKSLFTVILLLDAIQSEPLSTAFEVNLMHCFCLLVLLYHHFLLFYDVAFIILLALKLYNLIDFVNVLAPKDDFSQHAL
jgi:hypothetical protein